MKHPVRTTRIARCEKGGVLVLSTVILVVLLGMTALAIDLGLLMTARSQAQRAADAGAHGGAGVFLTAPGDGGLALAQARLYAENNRVQRLTLEVLDQDIDVIVDSQKVRVRVYRTQERGNPVATLFARILGFPTVDVSTAAAAQTWPGDATDCILPFAIPDRWDVHEGSGAYRHAEAGDMWDEERGDRYYSSMEPMEDGTYTGYGMDTIGDSILLKPGSPGDTPQPGWFYPIRLPGSQGAADYRASIRDCWDPAGEWELGDELDKEPGNMIGPTRQGFQDILNDPDEADIVWDEGRQCPARNWGQGECAGPESLRVRPVAMFDPTLWDHIAMGLGPVPLTSFGGIFIDRIDADNNVWVRWMQYATVKAAEQWAPNEGGLLRTLRIVE
jgi:hypothetical protein